MALTFNWQAMSVTEDALEQVPCDCCGETTVIIRGTVSEKSEHLASYLVRWTSCSSHLDPEFRLYFGDWSDDAPPGARFVMRADYRKSENAFMVIDAGLGLADTSDATYLTRDEVIGTPMAAECFSVIDAVFAKHTQLEEWRQ